MISYTKTILLFISLFAVFHAANIKGIVTDENSKEPLIGANVYIEETGNGSATDANGGYYINDVRSCSTCKYKLKAMYIGYENYEKIIEVFEDKEIVVDLNLTPTTLEAEITTVTAKKRQDKVVEAPAAIEIVSAADIKKEETTNLGSYLKGVKGVDFTSSGVNNYSISVRGFNSSFTSRLLTLTDGRIANIPALRSVNYSSVPQSSKDIESIEIVLGPSTALYGANAHSGVVNITSKSPALSEGLDLSISKSINDNRDLHKVASRWAKKVNDKLSFKISNTYIKAHEWEFVSEYEYKNHIYPYVGNPKRATDGKDNNPWGFAVGEDYTDEGTVFQEYGIEKIGFYEYNSPGPDGQDGTPDDIHYIFETEDACTDIGFECTPITKYVGDGEQNDTGDPDNDGFQGEDWYNGYDDDGDGLIDEDYFFADGIDNDGDCPGDTNADGEICSWGDEGVDEDIDWTSDVWIDGVDNNGNGQIDEAAEKFNNSASKFFLADWAYDFEFTDIIIRDIKSKDSIGGVYNVWYDPTALEYIPGSGPNPDYIWGNQHLYGSNYYDEDQRKIMFDVFIYDYGEDGLPGDNAWIDTYGDDEFTAAWEGGTILSTTGNLIPSEGCIPLPGNLASGLCSQDDLFNSSFDCGLDGICYEDSNLWDYGEGNGTWDQFDWNNDGSYTDGDLWDPNTWVDSNGDGTPITADGIIDDNLTWYDTFPYQNGIYESGELLLDCGQDGLCPTKWIVDITQLGDQGENWIDANDDNIYTPGVDFIEIINENYLSEDFGEGDGLVPIDFGELDGLNDTGDNCFGCLGDAFEDNNNDGIYNEGDSFDPNLHDKNGDGIYTPPDYQDNFSQVNDLNGDGFTDFPDFEVKNSKTEFRLDYDPNPDINITFQAGYSWSKSQQVTGIGRFLVDGYEYTYYQLRGRYKNWFSQIYLNQGNSGGTRGYDLGNRITDQSQSMAFQLQNNIKLLKNTELVWGIDYFRTEANTNGSILNDGPNGYDNDGDAWLTKDDNIDNDFDSDDFSDWGIDGIGPYLLDEGMLVIDCIDDPDAPNACEPVVNQLDPNASYDENYDLYYIDLDGNSQWSTNNPYYPYVQNPNYTGPDYGEGNGIPDGGEIVFIDTGDAMWNEDTGTWMFEDYTYNSTEDFWYEQINAVESTGDAEYNINSQTWIFPASYNPGNDSWYNILEIDTGDAHFNTNTQNWEFNYSYNEALGQWFDFESGETINVNTGDAQFNSNTEQWEFSTSYDVDNDYFYQTEIIDVGSAVYNENNGWVFNNGASYDPYTGIWYEEMAVNVGDAQYHYGNQNWTYNAIYNASEDYWWSDIDGDGLYDPGEPGVNEQGLIIVDYIDNDCDACDFDGDDIPNFQEIHFGTNIYNKYDYPRDRNYNKITPEDEANGIDELIDEKWCGDIQYDLYVPDSQFSGRRDGKEFECGENIDEIDEFTPVTSNEIGFYFQTKTVPLRNDKWEIITAARFDHHDQLEEDIQFSPKFGLFYKPNDFQTFRLTYGKAYNTPSAISMDTDIFMGRRGLVEYYLRGNKDGTPYTRVGEELVTSTPKVPIFTFDDQYVNETTDNIDLNNNGIIDQEPYTLINNWDIDLYNLGGLTNYNGYWDGIIENDWFDENDENENGIADLSEIDCNDDNITLCPYEKRVEGAPYFLGFQTGFSSVPEFIPLDTAIYTIWVPELTDTGRIYTPLESINIQDVDPIKTEKIQTVELGFKGFVSERVHLTVDYYTSLYEDFFSSPTIITPLVIERVFDFDQDGNRKDITSMDNLGTIVGMLTINAHLSNPPYATQWDGRDNDRDWHLNRNHRYLGTGGDIVSCPIETPPDNECIADWYDVFGWDGYEEEYNDYNNNNMYDYGETFIDEDNNGYWNCIDCSGEWGWILWEDEDGDGIFQSNEDTLGYNIVFPRTQLTNNEGFIDNQSTSEFTRAVAVGIDEYDPQTGLSEAELIVSSEISALGTQASIGANAWTPLHSILAPMNYGEVWMQGLDLGFTYLLPEYKVSFDTNFSFYGTTDYYNALTKKNDPINAPKFKMNASIGWQSPYGDIALKYRHVDKFEWRDGIWAGFIGPYDLFDLHYNYKINQFLELNLTALNIFDDIHKEMIGGAKMGRQLIMRLSASI